MVVVAVVRHWVAVMVEQEDGQDRHVQEGQHQSALFYAYGSMVASSDPVWLQGDFSTLVGMFDQVGLRTNFRKTVSMVYRPCQEAGTQLGAEYERRMAVAVLSYRERYRVRVQCSEYE